jgi:hypothetical protein
MPTSRETADANFVRQQAEVIRLFPENLRPGFDFCLPRVLPRNSSSSAPFFAARIIQSSTF